MFRFAFVCLCVFLTVAPWSTQAMTEEQKKMVHDHFEKIGMECLKDNVVTEEDIMKLRSKQVPTGDNAPCFMACMMRKMGAMDEHGMLQKDTVLEMAKAVFQDPEEVANLGDFLHSCSPVNDAAVGDGEKGCERAILALKCMLENSGKFGFDL